MDTRINPELDDFHRAPEILKAAGLADRDGSPGPLGNTVLNLLREIHRRVRRPNTATAEDFQGQRVKVAETLMLIVRGEAADPTRPTQEEIDRVVHLCTDFRGEARIYKTTAERETRPDLAHHQRAVSQNLQADANALLSVLRALGVKGLPPEPLDLSTEAPRQSLCLNLGIIPEIPEVKLESTQGSGVVVETQAIRSEHEVQPTPPVFETPEAQARAICPVLYPGDTLKLDQRTDAEVYEYRVERGNAEVGRVTDYGVSPSKTEAWGKAAFVLGVELRTAMLKAVNKARPGHPCLCHLRPFFHCPICPEPTTRSEHTV